MSEKNSCGANCKCLACIAQKSSPKKFKAAVKRERRKYTRAADRSSWTLPGGSR